MNGVNLIFKNADFSNNAIQANVSAPQDITVFLNGTVAYNKSQDIYYRADDGTEITLPTSNGTQIIPNVEGLTSVAGIFLGQTIDDVSFDGFDTSGVTNMNAMFSQATINGNVDLSDCDFSMVTTISNVFRRAKFNNNRNTEICIFAPNATTIEYIAGASTSVRDSTIDFSKCNFESVTKVSGGVTWNLGVKIINFDCLKKIKIWQEFCYKLDNLEELSINNIDLSELSTTRTVIAKCPNLATIKVANTNSVTKKVLQKICADGGYLFIISSNGKELNKALGWTAVEVTDSNKSEYDAASVWDGTQTSGNVKVYVEGETFQTSTEYYFHKDN